MNSLDKAHNGKGKTVVIMVHGTFATGDEYGEAWWQRGSNFWKILSSYLGENYSIPEKDFLFRWSGKNSDEERRKTGMELLTYLRSLESREIDYHIIAHSHGGIVVWNALKFSLIPSLAQGAGTKSLNPEPLRLLRSWTTVGTPFLQRTRIQDNPDPSGILAFLRAALSFTLGIICERHFKMLDHPHNFLRKNRNKKWGFLLPMAMFYAFFKFVYFLKSDAKKESNRRLDLKEQQADPLVVKEYGAKWLGVWSQEDEAMIGLSSTSSLQGRIMPRYGAAFSREHFSSFRNTKRMFSGPIELFILLFHDLVIAPRIDHFLWRRVKEFLQGNDRPGNQFEPTRPEPSPLLSGSPAVMQSLTDSLREQAEDAIRSKIHQLRSRLFKSIQDSSSGTGISLKDFGLTGDELVHCLYFQDDTLPKIIAAHIAYQTENNRPPLKIKIDAEITSYIDESKSHIKRCLSRIKSHVK